MPKFRWNKTRVPKYLKKNKAPAEKSPTPGMTQVQKNIRRQAGLALLTVVLTVVILFAMTSAWYTNIVQTSGLIFEAESWGFDGTIEVNNDAIVAAPGDDGLVQLRVQNASDSISAISVNVSKTGMAEEMQKRLFFYVDTHMNRDGETMDRVYLNAYEGYTYTVFDQGWLTLTEQAHNAPLLKWQWVYDVLGYYVLGQPQEVEGADGEIVEKMIVKEYLRPIEYDFDEATTKFVTDKDGELDIVLSTVDGKRSLETFLSELSKTDGYEGTIDPKNKTKSGYYPVDVDPGTGYGIYAYLCSYPEIQVATTFDTNLGKLAYRQAKGETLTDTEKEKLRHTALLSISAQKSESSTVNVTTLSGLENAMKDNTADVIQLTSDITIPADKPLEIPKDSRVMLDLNNHTITSNSTGIAIQANPGSSLTMTNGTLVGPASEDLKTYGVKTIGAEVVMSNMNISSFRYGIYLGDNEEENSLDSRVHMVNCNISANWYGVFASGNGSASQQKTQLIVENCTMKAGGYVITGNGSTSGNGRWGTDIQIINSTLEAIESPNGVLGTAIYQPQKDSTLTVVGSTVSGYDGIAIKGGSVSIVDSTITGKGAKADPGFSTNGFVDTGDAVYIETNYGWGIELEISGDSKLTSVNGYSLQVYEPDATNVSVKIHSGTFKEPQPDAYIAEGSVKDGNIVRESG